MKLISILMPIVKEQDSITFLVQKRVEDGPLDGLWEFPGGKIEAGESAMDSAIREFQEEVGVTIKNQDVTLFSQYHYQYDDRSLLFYVFYFNAKDYMSELTGLNQEKIPFESAQDVVQRAHIPAANKEFLMEFINFHQYQLTGEK